jgi:hypothetical protein
MKMKKARSGYMIIGNFPESSETTVTCSKNENYSIIKINYWMESLSKIWNTKEEDEAWKHL